MKIIQKLTPVNCGCRVEKWKSGRVSGPGRGTATTPAYFSVQGLPFMDLQCIEPCDNAKSNNIHQDTSTFPKFITHNNKNDYHSMLDCGKLDSVVYSLFFEYWTAWIYCCFSWSVIRLLGGSFSETFLKISKIDRWKLCWFLSSVIIKFLALWVYCFTHNNVSSNLGSINFYFILLPVFTKTKIINVI